MQEINYTSNHFIYLLLFVFLTVANFTSLVYIPINSYAMSLFYCLNIALTVVYAVNLGILIYGILSNTTPS